MEERLQKWISACGLMSRRAAEQAIADGRVTVNGQVAQLGQRADPERDVICLDGTPVEEREELVYLMLHKPRGYVTTLSDEKGRRSVDQLVSGCGRRVYPVGRLDLDSEGLLIMTNDGALTHRLTHPSHEVEKEYQVRVTGEVSRAVPILSSPMKLDGVPLRPARVRVLAREEESALLSVTIHEGKNRQVRRMCAAAGLTVVRLRRVREGSLVLGDLKAGQWRYLTEAEVSRLRGN